MTEVCESPAYINLKNSQRQLDADGIEVGVSRQALEEVLASYAEMVVALQPFAECCDQIAPEEDDEEWAKFRLVIYEYRRARAALIKARGGG